MNQICPNCEDAVKKMKEAQDLLSKAKVHLEQGKRLLESIFESKRIDAEHYEQKIRALEMKFGKDQT